MLVFTHSDSSFLIKLCVFVFYTLYIDTYIIYMCVYVHKIYMYIVWLQTLDSDIVWLCESKVN